MLIIRAPQMQLFATRLARRHEDAKLADLAGKFPQKSRQLGEAGVRGLIREAVRKGAQYRIHGSDDVSLIADLMMEFGSDFDTQPATAWAAEALTDASLDDDAKVSLTAARLGAKGRE